MKSNYRLLSLNDLKCFEVVTKAWMMWKEVGQDQGSSQVYYADKSNGIYLNIWKGNERGISFEMTTNTQVNVQNDVLQWPTEFLEFKR